MMASIILSLLMRLVLVLALISTSAHCFSSSKGNECIIQICHNKDCTKRGGGERLSQTFRDLLPSSDGVLVPSIESSGCLSKCGDGPNICVTTNGNKEKVYQGISDATSASAVLDISIEESYPLELLVAADIISKVGSTTNIPKKEQLLASAITQLTKDNNPLLLQSYAHGHALYLRADVRLEKSPPDFQNAINDARLAVQIVPNEIKAWRVLASAEEAGGDLEAAIMAVRKWVEVDSSFATKSKREIDRLMSML